MTGAEFLLGVNDALRGIDDDAPSFTSTEGQYWVRLLNRKKRELYEDVTRLWPNTFEETRTLGTVSASAAPSFTLDEDFLAPSDKVVVITTDNRRVEFELVKPQERNPNKRQAFIAGQDPQTLHFTNEIEPDENIVGGTVFLPGYYMPDDVTGEDDTIPFLTPDWAVLAVASEVAENDIVYEDKASNLNAKANNLYSLMVKKARRGTYANPRKSPTTVRRIRGVF